MSPEIESWPEYNPQAIEPKWQQLWEAQGLYLASEGGDKSKYYCLDFFPYPSGDGLHVGHCRNYVPTDVLSRYKRMNGYNVLHPMGWDAFGEPAEQYAVSHGVHPRVTTDRNTANFRRQMTLIGASYDWSRDEIVQLPVQVDGKLRDVIEMARDAGQDEVEAQILALPKVQRYTEGRQIDRFIYVAGKVVNLVTH